jgi:predicted phosphodiesterase
MYAVISDVHSNLEALNAALGDIKRRNIKDILFLGDAVGYGPEPNECIDSIRNNCRVLIAGNHDWAVTGFTPVENFNEYARAAVRWTVDNITRQNLEFLKTLDICVVLKDEELYLVHSTPKEPEAWHYILTLDDAYINFHYFEQKVCLLGHSHIPFIVEKGPTGELELHRKAVWFRTTERYIINVGSVGQPRDGDPRASYAIVDSEHAEIVRVEYDYTRTQEKMSNAGLPHFLINRLERGL